MELEKRERGGREENGERCAGLSLCSDVKRGNVHGRKKEIV